jgi:hypothetical protein
LPSPDNFFYWSANPPLESMLWRISRSPPNWKMSGPTFFTISNGFLYFTWQS